jgi:hypothetical protein
VSSNRPDPRLPWPSYMVVRVNGDRREVIRKGLTHAQALDEADYRRSSYVHPWAAYTVKREEE